jgi:acetylornithine deacetylase
VATAGEETGCKGATALVKNGFRVDGMVVGEPTRCRLVSAHKGTCWATLEARGQSCHASNPHLGNNAILVMSRALQHLEEVFLPSLQRQSHPLLGSPTCSVGMISGGTAPNIVPASCRIALDFRVLPGDDPAGLARRLIEELEGLLPEEELKLTIDQVQGGVDVPAESNLVRSLLGPCRERAGQEEPEGVHYFADSGPFFEAGIPCILFGPGDIAQAHTADEFLELDQLVLASDIALTWLEKGTERSLV